MDEEAVYTSGGGAFDARWPLRTPDPAGNRRHERAEEVEQAEGGLALEHVELFAGKLGVGTLRSGNVVVAVLQVWQGGWWEGWWEGWWAR